MKERKKQFSILLCLAMALMLLVPNGVLAQWSGEAGQSQQEGGSAGSIQSLPTAVELSVDGQLSQLPLCRGMIQCLVIDPHTSQMLYAGGASSSLSLVSPNGGENWQVDTQRPSAQTSSNLSDPSVFDRSDNNFTISSPGAASLWLEPATVTISASQEVILTLTVTSLSHISAISSAFTWSPTLLTLSATAPGTSNGVELGELFAGGNLQVIADPGGGRVDLSAMIPGGERNGPGNVVKIHFRVASGLAGGTVIPVSFLTAPPNQAVISLSDGSDLYPATQGSVLTVAGPAPQVSTDPASSLGQTAATLNGSVNPMGGSSKAWFRWGLTASYGSSTPSSSVGSGTATVLFSAPLSGLSPGTAYHFQAVAENPSGLSYGTDRTFTTSSGASPPILDLTASPTTDVAPWRPVTVSAHSTSTVDWTVRIKYQNTLYATFTPTAASSFSVIWAPGSGTNPKTGSFTAEVVAANLGSAESTTASVSFSVYSYPVKIVGIEYIDLTGTITHVHQDTPFAAKVTLQNVSPAIVDPYFGPMKITLGGKISIGVVFPPGGLAPGATMIGTAGFSLSILGTAQVQAYVWSGLPGSPLAELRNGTLAVMP